MNETNLLDPVDIEKLELPNFTKEEAPVTFGSRLRDIRRAAKITQRQLAGSAQCDFTYLSKIENGVMPPPSAELIERFITALNAQCDRDELFQLAGIVPDELAKIITTRKQLPEILRCLGRMTDSDHLSILKLWRPF